MGSVGSDGRAAAPEWAPETPWRVLLASRSLPKGLNPSPRACLATRLRATKRWRASRPPTAFPWARSLRNPETTTPTDSFRDIVVLTAQPVRKKAQTRHGALFALKHVNESTIFGTKTLWRGRSQISVSDLHRTIIDMLDDPAIGGGIQHVADCLAIYLIRGQRDDAVLLAYGDRLGNGAVFKRLGFLVERHSKDDPLVSSCRERLTTGNAALDPALFCPRLVTRWRLKVSQNWIGAGHS